ncbi:MAG: hypothetical protein WKG01_07470 [Kofleriaceae bacterium]
MASVLERFNDGEPTPCECICHHEPGIVHFRACCTACPQCGLLLSSGLAKHLEICQGSSAPSPSASAR